MSGSSQLGPKSTSAAAPIESDLDSGGVCPFCGTGVTAPQNACARCGMENNPATRQATRARLGPWYVLQMRNPSAPGMRYATLLSLVAKGRITARSVLRGPTTSQFWKPATQVRGVSRHFAVCYACGGHIAHNDSTCSHCARSQEPPADPDVLLDGADATSRRTAPPVFRQVPAEAAALAAMPSDLPAESAHDTPLARTSNSNDPGSPRPKGPEEPTPPPERSTGANAGRGAPGRSMAENRGGPAPGRSAAGGKGPRVPVEPGNGRDDDEPERPIEDRILSPRDLAAAFSLDFDSPLPQKGPPRSIGRLIAASLLVVLLAGASVVFFVPSLRATAQYRFNRIYLDLVTQQGDPTLPPLTGTPNNPPPGPTNTNPPPTQTPGGPTAATPTPAIPTPGGSTPGGSTPAVGSEPAASVTQTPGGPGGITPIAPGGDSTSPRQSEPAPAFGDLTPTVTYPTVPMPGSATQGSDRSSVRATQADFDTSRSLYRAAIDAESRRDYLTAATDYEAIERLPIDAWPGDVKIRLADVRKNLNK